MTGKEIVDGNKLIAEFMGYEYLPSNQKLEHKKKYGWNRKVKINSFHEKMGMYAEDPPERLFLGRSHHDLCFHRNWSWLMPVVKKVFHTLINESLGHCGGFYFKDDIMSDLSIVDIEEVFSDICRFIRWYNERKKS